MTAEKEQKTFSFVEMEHEVLDFWDQENQSFSSPSRIRRIRNLIFFMTGRLLQLGYHITGI